MLGRHGEPDRRAGQRAPAPGARAHHCHRQQRHELRHRTWRRRRDRCVVRERGGRALVHVGPTQLAHGVLLDPGAPDPVDAGADAGPDDAALTTRAPRRNRTRARTAPRPTTKSRRATTRRPATTRLAGSPRTRRPNRAMPTTRLRTATMKLPTASRCRRKTTSRHCARARDRAVSRRRTRRARVGCSAS